MRPDLPPDRATPLAGREEELGSLMRLLARVGPGQLYIVLCAGDPGIGKTRLLAELAVLAADAGAAVLRGGALEAEGMPPYLPLLEALGPAVARADPAWLQAQLGAAAPILAALLPEIHARLGPQPANYALPAEQARLRLFDSLSRLTSALAADAPLLLLLDDLHWADPSTFDVLAHLARRQGASGDHAGILVVGGYRPGDVAHRVAFERTVVELNRLRRLTELTLDALDDAAIGRLAASYLGGAVSAETLRLLAAGCEGNPFFAEELLRGWVGAGGLAQHEGRWSPSDEAGRALPTSLTLAIRGRLARLAPEVADLLRAAAPIGRTFGVPLLAELVERDHEATEVGLRFAAEARLIRWLGDDQAAFQHDTVRTVVYAEIPAARRRRLHERVVAILERVSAGGARHLADLAFHAARAGDAARGVRYARRAAEVALAASAPAEALALYRAALDLADAADPQRGELLRGSGAAAMAAGEERAAIEALAEAQQWFIQRGDPEQAAQAAIERGRGAWRVEDLDEAQRAFETACDLLAERSIPALAQALLELGSLLATSLHRYNAGLAACRRALALAYACEEPRLVAAASRALGNVLVRGGEPAEGIALLERGLTLAEQADDLVEASECCALLGHAYYWGGDLGRAMAAADRLLAHARRTGDPYLLRHVYALQAQGGVLQGRWADAGRWLDLAAHEVEGLSSPEPRAFLQLIRGNLAFERGDNPAALASYSEAIVAFRALGPSALVWYLGQYGVAQMAAGA